MSTVLTISFNAVYPGYATSIMLQPDPRDFLSFVTDVCARTKNAAFTCNEDCQDIVIEVRGLETVIFTVEKCSLSDCGLYSGFAWIRIEIALYKCMDAFEQIRAQLTQIAEKKKRRNKQN